ncbi:hypothetical protein PEY33_001599 [Campylobacter coli]|uniref:hypothetical protein n=1 Tax=Campylobacter coli TaxID=195 RepID=UPI0007268D14|nr:hypothetical protein [Campylobacter coli]EAC1313306.1 hypothetical protein [Campylobacter coli]EAH5394339.1 hypothetical protein [Campylobacter coli]EAI1994569.1 hypothetical protein [Campylobacter coli]EAI7467216.1 hypothetical protein [Campylobacter coli]EAJ5748124.1 hypothetical protein [Campylobacter coli]
MLELIFNTGRNIGLGIFVNGAFALQFSDVPQSQATYAIAEGILIMFLSGLGEIKSKGVKMEIILGIGAVTLVIVSIALVYTFYKEKHKTQH